MSYQRVELEERIAALGEAIALDCFDVTPLVEIRRELREELTLLQAKEMGSALDRSLQRTAERDVAELLVKSMTMDEIEKIRREK